MLLDKIKNYSTPLLFTIIGIMGNYIIFLKYQLFQMEKRVINLENSLDAVNLQLLNVQEKLKEFLTLNSTSLPSAVVEVTSDDHFMLAMGQILFSVIIVFAILATNSITLSYVNTVIEQGNLNINFINDRFLELAKLINNENIANNSDRIIQLTKFLNKNMSPEMKKELFIQLSTAKNISVEMHDFIYNSGIFSGFF